MDSIEGKILIGRA